MESVAQLPVAPDADSSTAELNGLRLKELRRQAKAEGAEPEQLEDAADADDPKAAVIELLLALRASSAASDGGLRAELEGLRLKELRQRARAEGVAADEMEEAADSDEPKAAMVELLLQRAALAS